MPSIYERIIHSKIHKNVCVQSNFIADSNLIRLDDQTVLLVGRKTNENVSQKDATDIAEQVSRNKSETVHRATKYKPKSANTSRFVMSYC